jgi:hypothetical protein
LSKWGLVCMPPCGSQRKIDATYVSEAVERAEFLESSTQKYGLRMLLSDSFHRLLHPSNRRRCRKIDQILIKEEDDEDADDEGDDEPNGDMMELFNFDIDIDSLWAYKITKPEGRESNSTSDSGSRSVHLEKFKGKIVDPLVRVRFIAAAVIPMNKTTVPSWEPPRPAGHAHVGFAHWSSVVQCQ